MRITHIPTGVVVSQQDEKSQHKNKAKALKILRSRVYEEEKRKKIKSDRATEEVKLELEIDRKGLEPIIFHKDELQIIELI